MKFKANFQYKPENFQMDDCRIERVVELSAEEFSALVTVPLRDHPAVAANKDCMFSEDGVRHCLLALGHGSNDGVLLESEGYNFPRYAAYIPGMRDIVNAEIQRAAECIVRQGVEKTVSGSWCVYTEELEESLGLTVRAGNGLDAMLREALERRPEVAEVEMIGDCIDTTYYLDYCRNLDKPGIEPVEGLAL